jgi:threonine dehydratase
VAADLLHLSAVLCLQALPSFFQAAFRDKHMMMQKESPLELAPLLSKKLDNTIWLKREDMQPVFSFKLRGAFNKMANLPKSKLEQGVICSSAGNHAQGVALAARQLGTSAVICMPVNTPEIKV